MEKQTYIAPELEVVEVKLEKGFATSPSGDTDNFGWGGDLSGN